MQSVASLVVIVQVVFKHKAFSPCIWMKIILSLITWLLLDFTLIISWINNAMYVALSWIQCVASLGKT